MNWTTPRKKVMLKLNIVSIVRYSIYFRMAFSTRKHTSLQKNPPFRFGPPSFPKVPRSCRQVGLKIGRDVSLVSVDKFLAAQILGGCWQNPRKTLLHVINRRKPVDFRTPFFEAQPMSTETNHLMIALHHAWQTLLIELLIAWNLH